MLATAVTMASMKSLIVCRSNINHTPFKCNELIYKTEINICFRNTEVELNNAPFKVTSEKFNF